MHLTVSYFVIKGMSQMVKLSLLKDRDKLTKVMIDKNVSSIIVLVCGIIGLISLLLPWEVLHLHYMFDGSEVGYSSLIELWTLDPRLNEIHWYWILALLPISFILCVVTPFLTKHSEKTSLRTPLYLFYSFVAALTLPVFHLWIERPKGTIMELHISSYAGSGFFLSVITIFGILIAAFVAFLESKPRFTSRSALLISVLTGVFVELSFFYSDWVTGWLWNEWADELRFVGFTGFQMAYDPIRHSCIAFDIIGLNIFELSSVSLMLILLIPLALYIVPVAGALVIISPFLHLTLGFRNVSIGRVARVGLGAAILAVSSFFLMKGKFSNPYYAGRGYMVAFGIWLAVAMGLFLIISEALLYMIERHTSVQTND